MGILGNVLVARTRWAGPLLVATLAATLVATLAACATGGGTGESEEDVVEQGGMGGTQPMGGMGGSPTGMPPSGTGGTGTALPGTGGMGGDPGPTCDPPQHLCGGICTGNTPATGCYQSLSCDPCPTVVNGTATCDTNGQCAAMCNSPYVPSGTSCVCPNQCCSDADCGSGASCQSGACVQDCDEGACIAVCLIQGKVGVCVSNQCTCL